MPTAWMPALLSASPARGSAKKPSLLIEWADGMTRQHSRLLNTTSALWNSSATFAKGTLGSVTFIRFTSPVRIIFAGILAPSGTGGRDEPSHDGGGISSKPLE